MPSLTGYFTPHVGQATAGGGPASSNSPRHTGQRKAARTHGVKAVTVFLRESE
ncbi:MAG: hypothetical protein LBJ08_11630 [Bifidobacteriaceae bacterium]|nr:hypothetical protein [Bifidobacteriaceae bacterium]